jgi:hypothetical protein
MFKVQQIEGNDGSTKPRARRGRTRTVPAAKVEATRQELAKGIRGDRRTGSDWIKVTEV